MHTGLHPMRGASPSICSSGVRLSSEDRCEGKTKELPRRGHFSHPFQTSHEPRLLGSTLGGKGQEARGGLKAHMWVMEVGPWV